MTVRANQAFDFFVRLGLTPSQAAGFVGNLQQESGPDLNPLAVGDRGRSIGIAQFQGPRRRALEAFAKSRGTKPTDFETQLEFIAKEFRSTERRAFEKLASAQTPEEAAVAGVSFFRPSKPRTENRVRFAQNLASTIPRLSDATQTTGLDDGGTIRNSRSGNNTPRQISSFQDRNLAGNNMASTFDIGTQLSGLLDNPLLNVGAGLLASAGPSEQPRSIGEGLLLGITQAQNAQGQAARNQLIRERILQQQQASQRRQTLSQALTGVGDEPQGLLGNLNPSQRQVLGLLAQADPEAAIGLIAQQAFPQERAEPAVIRSLRAIGVDPASTEGREIVLSTILKEGGSDEQLEQLIKATQLQLQGFQLEEMRRKRLEEEETQQQEFRKLETNVKSDLKKAEELAQLNEQLQGTFLETGTNFIEARRAAGQGIAELADLFGGDASKARDTIAAFDRFNKLAADFAIGSMERLEGTGSIQTSRFNALRDSLAGIGASTGANRLVIADTIDALLDGAKIQGIEIKEADQLRRLSKQLRGLGAPESPAPQPARPNQRGVDLGGGVTLEFN